MFFIGIFLLQATSAGENFNNNQLIKPQYYRIQITSSEDLFFPTTDSVRWIQSNNVGDDIKFDYTNVKENSLVLPDTQLWFKKTRGFYKAVDTYCTRIDKDSQGVATRWRFFDQNFGDEVIAFDAFYDRSHRLYAAVVHDNHISMRCVNNFYLRGRLLDIQGFFSSVDSLCFHHDNSQKAISIWRQDDPSDLTIITFRAHRRWLLWDKLIIAKEDKFRFNIEFKSLTKHEYMKDNTFLIVADNQLFLGTIKNSAIKCSKQEISLIENEEKKIFTISSAAAYHDQRLDTCIILTTDGTVLEYNLSDKTVKKICMVDADKFNAITVHENIISVFSTVLKNKNLNPSRENFSLVAQIKLYEKDMYQELLSNYCIRGLGKIFPPFIAVGSFAIILICPYIFLFHILKIKIVYG